MRAWCGVDARWEKTGITAKRAPTSGRGFPPTHPPTHPPPPRMRILAGFHYLRTAADVQKSRIDYLFGDIVRDRGLDPAVLDFNSEKAGGRETVVKLCPFFSGGAVCECILRPGAILGVR